MIEYCKEKTRFSPPRIRYSSPTCRIHPPLIYRQLEARLSFTFLPGLSWPGREVVSTARRGRHFRSAADPTDTNKRRNLAGLVPPMDKDMAAMISSTVAASPASLVAEGGGGGGGGAGQSLRGGRTALEDGNYSSTDDEGTTVAVGSGFARGEEGEFRSFIVCVWGGGGGSWEVGVCFTLPWSSRGAWFFRFADAAIHSPLRI